MAVNHNKLAAQPGTTPLAVHVVMHTFTETRKPGELESQIDVFVTRLCERLSGGERSPGIPVRLWRRQIVEGHQRLPGSVPLEKANRNLVLVLTDQSLFQARSGWQSYFTSLVKEASDRGDVILPVAIQADAARVSSAFTDVNHIFVHETTPLCDDERIFQSIYTALLRLLVDELPRVFLCHAKIKADGERTGSGEKIARNIRRYIYEQTQLSCFFDLHDIPHGHAVRPSIEKAIGQSVMLAVWTDSMLDSPWCQFELIEARRQQRPMLVLDALKKRTTRLFPFLGNMPVVCWKNNAPAVVSEILLEVLRTYHLRGVFESLSQSETDREVSPPTFGLHPPDLMDAAIVNSPLEQEAAANNAPNVETALFVYPDPPIKSNELGVLRKIIPSRRFLSLVEWRALRAANALKDDWDSETDPRPCPFRGLKIGVSVSASDTWAEMGLISQHQETLTSDIALELILLGTKVLWGGDLRPDGFGSQLKRIVKTYQHPSHAPQDHVGLFVPYSPDQGRTLNAEALQARRFFADVHVMPCPVRLSQGQPTSDGDSSSPHMIALAALAFSEMRYQLAKECDARIVLGGGLRKFMGLYPGIAEEAFETVRAGRPLYILGGFGGAARTVFEAITNSGAGRSNLLEASQQNGAANSDQVRKQHAELVSAIGKPELGFEPRAIVEVFTGLGIKGLSKLNGLTLRENERLAVSQNLHEILELLVKGLAKVRAGVEA